MAEEAKWYIAHTYSGYENKVATNLQTIIENRGLQDWIHEVFIPTEIITEVKDGQTKETERKKFPGYVFVKMVMTDESWFVVRNTRGCTGFVGPGGKPVPLTEKEVADLGVEKHQVEINYAVGDVVRVIDGPFEGFTGNVESIDTEKGTACVIVSMFGRDTPVELEMGQAELMD
ncbi:MAG: transcription termination/antitermination protein NusG [Clostridia bacterium]|nr:transcription termination/antitermination protein NusG [Clostridia bacterium]